MAEDIDGEDVAPKSNMNKVIIGILVIIIIFLCVTLINIWTSYVVARKVAQRETETGEVKLEEERKTVDRVLLVGDNKDKSFNAFIARSEEGGNLAVQMRVSFGVSNGGLRGTLETHVDPIKDRILAYLSQKTRRDLIYSFQRKVLGEEIKEIVNTILERDLKIIEANGRVTDVSVTKMLFITL